MRRIAPLILLLLAATLGATTLAGATVAEAAPDPDAWWPQWRGPLGTGAAPAADPPIRWSEQENLRWKVAIPGRGHASPVVWGDRIYLLTAIPSDDGAGPTEGERPRMAASAPVRFVVIAIDRATGETVWQRTAREEVPHEGTHMDGTWASASAVTDGRRVFAHFGSRGLFAYTADGERLWEKDLGDMTTRNGFGEGASPALRGETLVVNWDHEGESFIVALDAGSGRELWRRERDEVTSWSTPLVVTVDGRPQVVVAATGRTRAYDLETGTPIWEAAGMTTNTVPSPVHGDGLVFVTSGFRGNALQAIRPAGARGDLAGSETVVWSYDRDTPYVPSPVLHEGILYMLKRNNGVLTALDAATGKVLYGPQRLPGIDGAYASLVAARDRIYVAGRDGVTLVLAAGPEFAVIAENQLDDGFDASPALAGEDLLLRGRGHLYCLSERP
jgi:outer membrane protein assembly factor BamB